MPSIGASLLQQRRQRARGFEVAAIGRQVLRYQIDLAHPARRK